MARETPLTGTFTLLVTLDNGERIVLGNYDETNFRLSRFAMARAKKRGYKVEEIPYICPCECDGKLHLLNRVHRIRGSRKLNADRIW